MPNIDNPLVSIVVCCYNRAHLLPETMESVFAQNYQPVEIVVLDDGSTDNTSDLMKSYGGKIRYVKQENQGIAITRTNACRLAKGEYIVFQDDDDIMPPDRITALYEALSRYPDAVFAVGDWAEIDTNGKLTGKRFLPESSTKTGGPILINNGYEAVLWPKVPAAPHTILFRKADGEKIGWFDIQYKYSSEDKDFFARIGQLGPIVYVPKIVSYYRRGHVSLTSNRIVAPYRKLIFLKNHMEFIKNSNNELFERLQLRILMELKKISRLKSYGMKLPDSVSSSYLTNGLASLSFIGRIQYWWYSSIKLRIRKLIKN